jgi:predicted homoserine dehydrogenase-like protein
MADGTHPPALREHIQEGDQTDQRAVRRRQGEIHVAAMFEDGTKAAIELLSACTARG